MDGVLALKIKILHRKSRQNNAINVPALPCLPNFYTATSKNVLKNCKIKWVDKLDSFAKSQQKLSRYEKKFSHFNFQLKWDILRNQILERRISFKLDALVLFKAQNLTEFTQIFHSANRRNNEILKLFMNLKTLFL